MSMREDRERGGPEAPIPESLRRALEGAECPSSDALERFRRGELPEAEAEELAAHLIVCRDCSADLLARERIEEEEETAAARGSRWEILPARPRILRLPSRALLAAAAAVLVGASFVWLAVLERRGGFILEASLRGDRGLVRGTRSIARGERFSLELRTGRRLALAILHEDPEGDVAEVYPEGAAGRLEERSRSLSIPGPERAWDSAEIPPGTHALWIFAAERVLSPAERTELRAAVADAVRGSPPRPRPG
ncbi:MAG: hypothetical protein ACUVYA_21060, partial [Planctomycetota bacterium]